jgi:hypothetical protein
MGLVWHNRCCIHYPSRKSLNEGHQKPHPSDVTLGAKFTALKVRQTIDKDL